MSVGETCASRGRPVSVRPPFCGQDVVSGHHFFEQRLMGVFESPLGHWRGFRPGPTTREAAIFGPELTTCWAMQAP